MIRKLAVAGRIIARRHIIAMGTMRVTAENLRSLDFEQLRCLFSLLGSRDSLSSEKEFMRV
jgi:hypothetical protein